MADWGGSEAKPFTTEAELACGQSMGEMQPQVDAKFALALGDNFYSHGISSDVTDSRFNNTFENAFPSPNLMTDGFFRVVAGNHDHAGLRQRLKEVALRGFLVVFH